MKYLSVCSGIEAASAAWHQLGWEPVAFAELEPFPSAVLAHHYPSVPNWGDMTRYEEWPDATFDVLVGGTPCQSFSVAGKRGGMDDPRGQLAYAFAGIAARYRPEWIVWENVFGVLSSAGGRDFAGFVRGLAELGYQCAWRVLDAQHFGVPQRRRRLFLIGNSGGWQRAAAVLFERSSMLGNPPPSRKAREGASFRAKDGPGDCRWPALIAPTLNAAFGDKQGLEDQHALSGAGLFVPDYVNSITAHNGSRNEVSDIANGCVVEVAHTLSSEGFDASEDGTGRGTPLVPVHAFDARQSDVIQYGDMTGPLDTDGHSVAVAIRTANTSANGHGISPELAHTLDQAQGQAVAVQPAMQVRRLTPVECSRLQGFPDDYLELTYADADEAHSAQVLHELWQEAGAPTVEKQGWRAGISAALLAPEILLAGVYGGWLSWELAERCAAARGALPGEDYCHEGFVLALREAGKARRSPYKRESFGQLARKLGSGLSILPLESAQARKVLRSSRLWPEAQAKWPLRYALAKGKAREAIGRMNPDGPRYKALGNSMAVPVMRWIGKRIDAVAAIKGGAA